MLCALLLLSCSNDAKKPAVTYSQPPATTYSMESFTYYPNENPVIIRGAVVTHLFFPDAGIQVPMLGRLFIPGDFSSSRVVILSYRFWQETFNSDPAWIGRTLRLNGQPYTIIGVLPRNFEIPTGAVIWVPQPGSE